MVWLKSLVSFFVFISFVVVAGSASEDRLARTSEKIVVWCDDVDLSGYFLNNDFGIFLWCGNVFCVLMLLYFVVVMYALRRIALATLKFFEYVDIASVFMNVLFVLVVLIIWLFVKCFVGVNIIFVLKCCLLFVFWIIKDFVFTFGSGVSLSSRRVVFFNFDMMLFNVVFFFIFGVLILFCIKVIVFCVLSVVIIIFVFGKYVNIFVIAFFSVFVFVNLLSG